MKIASSKKIMAILSLILILSAVLSACGTAQQEIAVTTAAEDQSANSEQSSAAGPLVNSIGVTLPEDAAPLDQQVLHIANSEYAWLTQDASAYDSNDVFAYAVTDSCIKMDHSYNLIPSLCTSWEVSEDGLTWTFHLQEGRVWSDNTPITADDVVFTMQRYARIDNDYEWFYSMAGITNWAALVNGEVEPEALGVAKVDDLTFTVTTDVPTPYVPNLFALVYPVPKHVVQDRLADGSWALNDETRVSSAPYVIETYEKGVGITLVPNATYTGPYRAMMEKIVVTFMEGSEQFNAYLNDELDVIGYGYQAVLNPAAMAQVNADPELKSQLLVWPNLDTYYLFFDTWNEPFNNLALRQAFSHAIDRDALINGPLQYQAQAAYSMNPPGFPGENVEGLKTVQNYDPELAAELMAEAGYPNGEGFPPLTLYLRDASSTMVSAAEAIVAMLKENLGVTIEVQNLDYDLFSEKMWNQKINGSGDFIFAFVPYEYDFIDGSNMLSGWGGCETEGASMGDMPGRHTWYNQEYNQLLCTAQSLMGDEEGRNAMYQQAERILIEDVALVPIYHSIYNVLVKPDLAGPGLAEDATGMRRFRRFDETQIYRTITR